MSHELRTPLNSLLILSKMLAENKDGNLTPEQVKFAKTVYSSGNDLLALINEILDLSKVEAGKMPIDPKDVQSAEVQDYLEQTFRHVAEQKGLELRDQDGRRRCRDSMFTDVNRLQQILKNLLSNAFKFTEQGSVALTISWPTTTRLRVERSTEQNVIAFSVTDTGIGIPPDKQKLIFEAFQQADGTTSRKYGGTGLGLTISREIARLLGGSIEVRERARAGQHVHALSCRRTTRAPRPLRDSRAPTRAPRTTADIPPLPDGRRLHGHARSCVVDDDIRNIFAINSVLEARRMKVLHAENGKLGIELLEEQPGRRPGADGHDDAGDGRSDGDRGHPQDPRFRKLPIISLTAKAMKGDREKALEAGASDYVTKPVDPEKLLSVMHMWLGKVTKRVAALAPKLPEKPHVPGRDKTKGKPGPEATPH